VIGFPCLITDGSVNTYITELLVARAWRGRGIGRALVDACQALVPATGLDLLSTDQADPFYEAREFRHFQGFRKGI
jgi:GNAT superfamily N-acetyltransferase